MDKADLALLISAFSATIALASAKYTRRLAINDTKRMNRQHLVCEVTLNAVDDAPHWSSATLIVRNLEAVAAKLWGIRSRGRNGGIMLSSHPDLPGDGYGNKRFPAPPPHELLTKSVDLDIRIRPQGKAVLYLYTYRISAAREIDPIWEWADGSPK